jgi:TRAP-type C4-dicarboxylate transport system permease small subunit
MISRVSAGLLAVEKWVLIALTAAITVLILLNVVTRSLGAALFWVDETAIYTMIWAVFIGASVQLRLGSAIAVDLVPMMLGRRGRFLLRTVVDVLVLAFALTLLWLAWIWYDPAGLARAGFDIEEFSMATFNFIYQEPTVTVGAPKFLFWLVIPIFAVSLTIHATANLVETLQGRPRPSFAELGEE